MKPNVIFDLGGVIEHIDITEVEKAFIALGMQDAQQLYNIYDQERLISNFERGYISVDDFCDAIISRIGIDGITRQDVKGAWNKNQLGVPPKVIDVLNQLKSSGHSLYVLSNTNPIHIRHVETCFEIIYGFAWRSLFKGVFLSYEVGMRKPGQDIYEYVLHQIKAEPEDCVYIDDRQENMLIPQQLGMKCIAHKTNADLNYLAPLLGDICK